MSLPGTTSTSLLLVEDDDAIRELLASAMRFADYGVLAAAAGPMLRCADLLLDEDARRVWRGEDEIVLTPTEFRLLTYLLTDTGTVMSKDQILERVWGQCPLGDRPAGHRADVSRQEKNWCGALTSTSTTPSSCASRSKQRSAGSQIWTLVVRASSGMGIIYSQ